MHIKRRKYLVRGEVMPYKIVQSGDKRERRNFSKISKSYEVKGLLDVQKLSYNWFQENSTF